MSAPRAMYTSTDEEVEDTFGIERSLPALFLSVGDGGEVSDGDGGGGESVDGEAGGESDGD